MDVTNEEQARIAETAGAVAVMALERVPADIRAAGGVARMADPEIILRIMDAVTIPVMAKCRIGHFVEAQILEALGVDFIDESEVLTPADEHYHIDKRKFTFPFVCGCRDLGEALRRIGEGAAMLRTKGEAGTGNVVEAVRHMRRIMDQIRQVQNTPDEELMTLAKELGAPHELLLEVKKRGALPVVNFAAGGIATPADAALMMQLGADGVFVGSEYLNPKIQRKEQGPLLRPRCIMIPSAWLPYPRPGRGDAGLDVTLLAETEQCRSGCLNAIFPGCISRLQYTEHREKRFFHEKCGAGYGSKKNLFIKRYCVSLLPAQRDLRSWRERVYPFFFIFLQRNTKG